MYPDTLDTRPLTTWPGELTPWSRRVRSNFSATLSSTTRILTTELHQLGARHPVLELAIPLDQWRIDGRPRANAREAHPGVVLSLPHTSVGALRYATDTFDRWQDNLRAITLGLEALRKVDRYGITKRGEQYQGFKALPPGATPMPAAITVDEAARILRDADTDLQAVSDRVSAQLRGEPVDFVRDAEARNAAFRRAARRHHPDVGGDRATWDRLEQAKRVLDEHAGVPA